MGISVVGGGWGLIRAVAVVMGVEVLALNEAEERHEQEVVISDGEVWDVVCQGEERGAYQLRIRD